MIGSVRGAMAAPFAKPPGGQAALRRLAPEIAAAAAYAVLLGSVGLAAAFGSGADWATSAGWAILVGSLLMMVLPAWFGAESLARERSRGTLEALLLLPVGRERLAWGRYCHASLAWLRLALWMLPLHAMWMCRALAGMRETSVALVFWASAPGPVLDWFVAVGPPAAAGAPEGLAYALLARVASDGLGVLTAVAVGLCAGARVRHGATAGLLAAGAVLVLSLAVFGAPAWAIVLLDLATGSGRPPGYLAALSAVGAVMSAGAQVLAIRWLVRGAARGLGPEAGEVAGETAERPD
jgi:ABC-type Na+ efflux pump permease subunit